MDSRLTASMQRDILSHCFPVGRRLKVLIEGGSESFAAAYDNEEVDWGDVDEFMGEALELLYQHFDLYEEEGDAEEDEKEEEGEEQAV